MPSAWPTVTSWPGGTAWPSGVAFPSTVSPAMWFDGNQAMFSDIAGTTPAAVGDPLGRNNEASPLVSNWQAPQNTQRGRRDAAAGRFDYFGPGTPGQTIVHASTPAINLNDTTMVVSFVPRDATTSGQIGLLRANVPQFGITGGAGKLQINYNSGTAWNPAVATFVEGQRVTIGVRWTSTGLRAVQLVNGSLSSDTLTTAVTGGTTSNQFSIADGFGACQGFYGSVAQAILVNRGVSDSELSAMLNWAAAQPMAVGYPTTAPLFAVVGDSIARAIPGVAFYQAWCWVALQNARSTYSGCEMLNAAIVGGGTSLASYNPIIPFYSASRSRNVLVVSCGTNDLANGNGQTTVRDNLFLLGDTARAAGWRVACATILDRTGSLSISQASFDSQRAFVNAAILGSGTSHFDALIDMTGTATLSANGASASGTYFIGDGIHPNGTGQLLMEPIYRAQMLALAA